MAGLTWPLCGTPVRWKAAHHGPVSRGPGCLLGRAAKVWRGGEGGAQAPLSLPSPPFPFPPLLPPRLPSRWMDRWMLVGDAAWRNGSGGPTRPILPSSHLRRRSKRCAAIPLERRMRSPSRQTPRSMNCCLQIRGRVGAGMSTDSFSFFSSSLFCFSPPVFLSSTRHGYGDRNSNSNSFFSFLRKGKWEYYRSILWMVDTFRIAMN